MKDTELEKAIRRAGYDVRWDEPRDSGAKEVYAYAAHAVLSGPALERINASCLHEVVVTNTIPVQDKTAECSKLRVLSVADLLAEAIRRIHGDESVSSLFV